MKARDNFEYVKRVNDLPDDAIVPDAAAAILLGISYTTLRRVNPVPRIQISERLGGRRLGDIRALGRGMPAKPLKRR
jgi:hypothetical protein